jgi:hypothetical protein
MIMKFSKAHLLVLLLPNMALANEQTLSTSCIGRTVKNIIGNPGSPQQINIEFVNNCGQCVNLDVKQYHNGQLRTLPFEQFRHGSFGKMQPGEARVGTMWTRVESGTTELRVDRVTTCAIPAQPKSAATAPTNIQAPNQTPTQTEAHPLGKAPRTQPDRTPLRTYLCILPKTPKTDWDCLQTYVDNIYYCDEQPDAADINALVEQTCQKMGQRALLPWKRIRFLGLGDKCRAEIYRLECIKAD